MCPRRIGSGDIIRAFKKKILERLSGWSRHIDPGLVQEDGLGSISISLPATELRLLTPHVCSAITHPCSTAVILVAVPRIGAGVSEGPKGSQCPLGPPHVSHSAFPAWPHQGGAQCHSSSTQGVSVPPLSDPPLPLTSKSCCQSIDPPLRNGSNATTPSCSPLVPGFQSCFC